MAPASDTRTRAHLQPAHLPPAGRSLTSGQHRRGMLASLAGLAAGAAAATAQATDPDPLLSIIARAEAFRRQGEALHAAGDEAGALRLWSLQWQTDDEALATQPGTMLGLVEQLRTFADRLVGGTRGREDADDLYRLAGFAETLAGRA